MNLIDSVGACCRLVFWDVDRESNAVWRWYNVRKQVRENRPDKGDLPGRRTFFIPHRLLGQSPYPYYVYGR